MMGTRWSGRNQPGEREPGWRGRGEREPRWRGRVWGPGWAESPGGKVVPQLEFCEGASPLISTFPAATFGI